MRDGTALKADIYWPSTDDGPWPVLLQRTPYDKRSWITTGILEVLSAVQRGYIVVQQDTRGRYGSEGEWLPWAHEQRDGFDTVEWASQLPGSNGKVGMFGGSYTGNTQWSAALAQAPGLTAIAPQVTWHDPDNGLFFRGGAIELGLNGWWSMTQSLTQLPKAIESPTALVEAFVAMVNDHDMLTPRGYWELPAAPLPSLTRTGLPDIGVQRAIEQPETREECRIANQGDRVTIPSLNIAGWYDVFQQGSLDNYVEMRRQGLTTRLIVGPWEHLSVFGQGGGQTGEVNFGIGSVAPPAPGIATLTDVQLEWFDHYLRGEPATTAHDSGVKIFVMGVNQWRDEKDWPLERRIDTAMYLGQHEDLSFDAPTGDESYSQYTYDPADPTPTTGGAQILASEFTRGPKDQSSVEGRADVLVFSTPPLERDLEVTGRVRATLFASTDGPSTDWVVRLCDVDERGVSRNIVDGIVRATTEAGRVDEYDIDLWSTSIVFKAGHQIRVQVTSSNFPRWDRNLNTGEGVRATEMRQARQKIYHDAERRSHIVLPVIP
ncbi:X-Pro dipeptidyl-peptidase [Rhodococcus sp. LB1]|nr:X-Pro dipeptidyl-peptidase [Rhodococcus sp. LB1]